MHDDMQEVLYSEAQVQQRVRELGALITESTQAATCTW